MSNLGFESPEEWSKLLKLDNFLYIHAKKWKIGNDPRCVLTSLSQLLLGQNWKSRTVLKSSGQADFKTDLPFWNWWRFDVVIAIKKTKVQVFCGHGVSRYHDWKENTTTQFCAACCKSYVFGFVTRKGIQTVFKTKLVYLVIDKNNITST